MGAARVCLICLLLGVVAPVRAEDTCPGGWQEVGREDLAAEIRIRCRRVRLAAIPAAAASRRLASARPEPRPSAAPASPILAAALPVDILVELTRLAGKACSEPGSVSQDELNREYRWLGGGREVQGEPPADAVGCTRALLLELLGQHRTPTPGLFNAEWVNRRARELLQPPPPPAPPPRPSEKCEGFWSEGRKWICVDEESR